MNGLHEPFNQVYVALLNFRNDNAPCMSLSLAGNHPISHVPHTENAHVTLMVLRIVGHMETCWGHPMIQNALSLAGNWRWKG